MESIDPTNLTASIRALTSRKNMPRCSNVWRSATSTPSLRSFSGWTTTPWRSRAHAEKVRTWPAGLPIFGLLTPLPGTPLLKRLEAAGRLTRPKHWQEFIPFAMAHTPLKMSIEEAHAEVLYGWSRLRPGSHRASCGLAPRSTTRLPHQHLHFAHVFPRNLFPHARPLRLVESNLGESPHHLKTCKRRVRRVVGLSIQTSPSASNQRGRLGRR